ncbi:MAG TPA: ATP-binding cassette domain-containing protein [Verrucomicrobiae bacterium]
MNLQLKNIVLSLADFALEIDVVLTGQATAIFGHSGAGKTSLLELIAGLRRPKSAVIALDDQLFNDTSRGVSLRPRDRQIGYVPQDLVLFPHFTARKNILYGAKPNTSSGLAFDFEHVVKILELESLLGRSIAELSGGEKRRVALARALVSKPKLLLLDEPLSNLDEPLKARILPYLARIREEFRVPMLYVTHDEREGVGWCEEAFEMSRGKIVQRAPKTAS